jgi:hypothetical protein
MNSTEAAVPVRRQRLATESVATDIQSSSGIMTMRLSVMELGRFKCSPKARSWEYHSP